MGLRIVLCCVIGVIAAAPPNNPPTYDTIVVGLGAAGFTAATTLTKAGVRVLGLEAQARVGGRVNTVPFGDGVVELGAEWIHGTENSRTYDLAIKTNVSILPTPRGMKFLLSDGTAADEALITELLEFAESLLDEHTPDPPEPCGNFTTRKLMEYIAANKPDLLKDQEFIAQFLHFANLYMQSYDASNDWNDVSTFSRYEQLKGNQAMSWHRNGYKTFFEKMMNSVDPNWTYLDILLNTEVTQIIAPQNPDEKVVVKCKDGSSYETNHVIVTVSLGVLKAKHSSLFSPPLPKDKQTAIDKLSIGTIDKIVLAFDEVWWPQGNVTFFGLLWKGQDKEAAKDQWTTRLPAVTRPMGAGNVLTIWVSGDPAREMEALPDDVVKTKCVELLQRFLGKHLKITVPQPTAMIRSSWYTNPFTRGSYSFDNLETPQYPDARAWLGAPLTDAAGAPRVLFAGEATNLNHFSTVHGASETGYREAMRLLQPKNASEQ